MPVSSKRWRPLRSRGEIGDGELHRAIVRRNANTLPICARTRVGISSQRSTLDEPHRRLALLQLPPQFAQHGIASGSSASRSLVIGFRIRANRLILAY